MSEYKDILGALAAAIGIAGYIVYFRDIFWRGTKPHAFSWFVWFVLTAIAFAAQVAEGAGPGAWVMGISALGTFGVFLLALWRGNLTFPLFDWVALGVAFFALWLWWVTSDPTLSVILITLTDAAGYLPTFRKGFEKPFDDSAEGFMFGTIKYIPSLMALENYSIATWLYPVSLVFMNGAFVAMLLVRRHQLQK